MCVSELLLDLVGRIFDSLANSYDLGKGIQKRKRKYFFPPNFMIKNNNLAIKNCIKQRKTNLGAITIRFRQFNMTSQ